MLERISKNLKSRHLWERQTKKSLGFHLKIKKILIQNERGKQLMTEHKTFNLTNDYIFKRIFGKEGNEDIKEENK